MPLTLDIPEFSLVVLMGAAGSGKSTLAQRHFKASEVLSSDNFRAMVSDEEDNQSATPQAFELLHLAARHRLQRGLLTVVDATNLTQPARQSLVRMARQFHCRPVVVALDTPLADCIARDAARPRSVGAEVITAQVEQFQTALTLLRGDGFKRVHLITPNTALEHIRIHRVRLQCNLRNLHGPFDIIGDIHGCFDELKLLMTSLGYRIDQYGAHYVVHAPPGRRVIFLGDLVDRGPGIVPVLTLVMDMVEAGTALCLMGNHESKLLRHLQGRPVRDTHGFLQTRQQLTPTPPAFQHRLKHFVDNLASHYVLDGGALVVAHAGLKAELHGRESGGVKAFALYGETTGETDGAGLPERLPWAEKYRGEAAVVYGHTPVETSEWLNNTLCVDTGCVYGGKLTALRWPERALCSVPALGVYCAPNDGPLEPPARDS